MKEISNLKGLCIECINRETCRDARRNLEIVECSEYNQPVKSNVEQTKQCECKYHGLEKCECEYHGLEKGDALYVYESWDGGIEFNAIKNIKYCPICGKELPEER